METIFAPISSTNLVKNLVSNERPVFNLNVIMDGDEDSDATLVRTFQVHVLKGIAITDGTEWSVACLFQYIADMEQFNCISFAVDFK